MVNFNARLDALVRSMNRKCRLRLTFRGPALRCLKSVKINCALDQQG